MTAMQPTPQVLEVSPVGNSRRVGGFVTAFMVIALVFAPVAVGVSYVVLATRITDTAVSACNAVNKTRSDISTFIHQSLSRSIAAAEALAKNPASTPEQLAVARHNRDQLRAFVERSDRKFAAQACKGGVLREPKPTTATNATTTTKP